MKPLMLLLLAFQLAPSSNSGWKKFGENEYALKPADNPMYLKIPFKQGVRLRVEVQAQYAVEFLVRSKDLIGSVDLNKKLPSGITCFQRHIIKSSASCEMPSDSAYLGIRDERRDPRTRESAPQNKVIVTLWYCMENCTSAPINREQPHNQ